jgi:uncharacterized protein (TIGR02246 family)
LNGQLPFQPANLNWTRRNNIMQPTKDAIVAMAKSYAKSWSSKDADQVAAHYEPDGQIIINKGDILKGTAAVTEMAAGFHAAFPDMMLMCDDIRISGNHAVFVWTFYGHHSETKSYVKLSGWEEWEISDNVKVQSSCGWYDANDYDAQVAGTAK